VAMGLPPSPPTPPPSRVTASAADSPPARAHAAHASYALSSRDVAQQEKSNGPVPQEGPTTHFRVW